MERPGEGLWGAQEVGTSAIDALEDWTGRKVSTDPCFPFCRCCSVLLSPQLYRDVPILRVHSFLLGGADGPRYGTVVYPGPCRLRPRLVSGPNHLPGILTTLVGGLGGNLEGLVLRNLEMQLLSSFPLCHQKNLTRLLPSPFSFQPQWAAGASLWLPDGEGQGGRQAAPLPGPQQRQPPSWRSNPAGPLSRGRRRTHLCPSPQGQPEDLRRSPRILIGDPDASHSHKPPTTDPPRPEASVLCLWRQPTSHRAWVSLGTEVAGVREEEKEEACARGLHSSGGSEWARDPGGGHSFGVLRGGCGDEEEKAASQ